ncbi:hypothetical protein O9929_02890 [Vibrio lentus]|nr:hypothetical protein [Vibrio lentus]
MALATSLSTIIVTSGSSAINHLKLGNVEIFCCTFFDAWSGGRWLLGSFIADVIPARYLPKVFGCDVLILALRMLLSIDLFSKK